MRTVTVLALTAALAAAGCDSHLEARVGDALLPQALGVVPAAAGPTVVVMPGQPTPAFAPGPVRVAIDHAVPWREVEPLLAALDAAGARPAFLVGQRQYVHAFPLSDELADAYTLRLRARATGTFCLSPPGTREAYCVEGGTRMHISSMYVREAVQKAVAEYRIRQAWVIPEPDTRWADVVRTIDGARTCCPDGFRVAVARAR